MTSIFVAKLDFNTTDEQLKSLFDRFGKVNRVTIAKDRETGKPRGFAFVEMFDEQEADAAIQELDGSTVNGRQIAVKKADDRAGGKPSGGGHEQRREFKPREDRPAAGSTDLRTDYKKLDDKPARPAFAPEEVKPIKTERKKEREKPSLKEAPKKHKMEAYKKSGKNSRFFDDEEDDDDYDYDTFRKKSGWTDDEEE